MLDLSTIINDLLTGKAEIKDIVETLSAAAGAAIASPNNVFHKCPSTELRLMLGGRLSTTKTTGTALTLKQHNKEAIAAPGVVTGEVTTFLVRTIGTEVIEIPSWEAAGTDLEEAHPNRLHLFQDGDHLRLTHALTAAETIVDTLTIRYIIWQVGKDRSERAKILEKIVFHAPPTM